MVADFSQLDFKRRRKKFKLYLSVVREGCGGGLSPAGRDKGCGYAFARPGHSKPGVSLWERDLPYKSPIGLEEWERVGPDRHWVQRNLRLPW